MLSLNLALGLTSNGGAAWTPASLRNTVAPFWEATGLAYQDVTGQTLAEDVTDPVALLLDGGKVVLGADIVTSFQASDWVPSGTNTVVDDGNDIVVTYVDTASGATVPTIESICSEGLTVGEFAEIKFTAHINSGSATVQMLGDNGAVDIPITETIATEHSFILALRTGSEHLQVRNMAVGRIVTITNLQVRKLIGYHATQPITAQQPEIDEVSGEVLGDELATATASLGSGWTDNGDGTYTCDGTQGTGTNLTIIIPNLDASKSYRMTWEQAGGYIATYLGTLGNLVSNTDIDGAYSYQTSPDSDGSIVFRCGDSVVAAIGNISFKEIESTYTHRIIRHDGIDDQMSATLPDLGTDASKWTVNMAGVTIEDGLTIGAGAYDLPTNDWSATGLADRAFTIPEVNKLLSWAQRNHTPARYATMKTRMDVIMANAVDAAFWDTTAWRDSVGGIGAELAGTLIGNGTASAVDNGDHTEVDNVGAGDWHTNYADTVANVVAGTSYWVSGRIRNVSGNNTFRLTNNAVSIKDFTDLTSVWEEFGFLYTAVASGDVRAFCNGFASTNDLDLSIKTTDQSWFWEEKNTATRGATSMPPALGLVVAEDNRVVIYDMDDPEYPMFKIHPLHADNPVFATPTSVAALNGVVAIGTTSGLAVLDYIDDSAIKHTTGADEVYDGPMGVDGLGWV